MRHATASLQRGIKPVDLVVNASNGVITVPKSRKKPVRKQPHAKRAPKTRTNDANVGDLVDIYNILLAYREMLTALHGDEISAQSRHDRVISVLGSLTDAMHQLTKAHQAQSQVIRSLLRQSLYDEAANFGAR